ncbi:MAG: hypothetical protein EBX72_07290, partial [Betaproteobacteria bacterium]|nr:hypothetical protein [Betaproteobacteria bacterium]
MPEDDGVVRRLPPLLRYRDQWHASLSLAVLACMGLVPEKASITPRWPAVPLEIAFNLAILTIFLFVRQRRLLPGQLFHVYLMAYGVFRFAHEF